MSTTTARHAARATVAASEKALQVALVVLAAAVAAFEAWQAAFGDDFIALLLADDNGLRAAVEVAEAEVAAAREALEAANAAEEARAAQARRNSRAAFRGLSLEYQAEWKAGKNYGW